jgi:malonate-semialdehyde dehydrogenase (acetylating) / methylmalonate-semialdehyde dehydrogenase
MKRINHWIDGKSFESASGRHGEVFNPATGEIGAHVDFADLKELEFAVASPDHVRVP